MTENIEDKPKKLTLGSSKLSFTKPIDSSGITKTFVSSRSNTIVEVKKTKVATPGLSLNKISGLTTRDSEVNSEDFNKRLNVLKKAAEEAKAREPDLKFSSLSKLAA